MRISVVTDEVSSDLETALELAAEWGAEGVEIRGIGEDRYPDVSPLARERCPELLRSWGLPVAAISPGLFKIPLAPANRPETSILRWEDSRVSERRRTAERVIEDHLDRLLPASISAARELDCPTIVCFSFEDPGWKEGSRELAPELVVDALRAAGKQVEAAGLVLAIEVEHVCWAKDASTTVDLLERVGIDCVGVNWDPANSYVAGEDAPFPDGWALVRDVVRHVHYKQARQRPDGSREFAATGILDWRGQIEALVEMGYEGWISVESHARPKVAVAAIGVRELVALRDDLEGKR